MDAASSRLEVVYLIDGQERLGAFSRFEGRARFDPEELSAASLELVIDMDSLDVGEPFGTLVVKTVARRSRQGTVAVATVHVALATAATGGRGLLRSTA